MSTKTKKDKYPFIEQGFTTSENQNYNLNLNQSKKYPILVPLQSYSKSNNDEHCVTDKKKEELQLWNKLFKISTFTTVNEDNDDLKKQKDNANILKSTNKSTLSLHIEAYENSIEAVASDLFDYENIEGLKKEKINLKSRNPFEFPRQQNGDQRNIPEIMQFKTSQQLTGSNRPSSSQQNGNNDGFMVESQMSPGAGTACPLCLEKLEADDLHFYPCSCSYQVCTFCWHRIKTDENGLCPACRQPYSENPVTFCPPTTPSKSQQQSERKIKEKEKKLKQQDIIESRKHLSLYRVIQKNLVYVVGLPQSYANDKFLRSIFEKNGKVTNLIVGTLPSSYSDEPLNTAYITYSNEDDALQAICDNINLRLGGHNIKVTLGTTKYCQYFLKAEECTRQECSYLHDIAAPEISFTKEDMQQGKHIEYEKDLIIDHYRAKHIDTYPPVIEYPVKISATPVKLEEKEMEKEKKAKQQEMIEARKHLSIYRVIQRNLVYVVGLPQRYANDQTLRNIFEKHGEISKMIVGTLPSNFSSDSLNTAYITYVNGEDALHAICANSKLRLGGRNIKVTLGTTKYCQFFLKGEECTRQECSYLHDIAPPEISFTKEDMHQGKHMEYEHKLIFNLYRSQGVILSSDETHSSDESE
uniref:CCR4-NOT transcription complex subunit 4 n=1 Tax=Panagrolaimus sp. PS1159 TaxID=55785 RepID=A0AC35GTR0_9BILA